MGVSARSFPYEKPVILNVLYDALDAVDISIDHSNSMRGTLLVSLGGAPEDKMRIAISPSLNEDETLIEIFPESEGFENGELITALFDEMDALIKRAGIEPEREG